MSFSDFLNKTCTIRRYTVSGTVNEFGEEIKTITVVGTLVPCRIEKLYDRELVEMFAGGDHAKGIYVVYFENGINIRNGDVLVIDGMVPDWEYITDGVKNDLTVMDVDDAGGGITHHLEVFCRYRKGIN